MGGRNRRLTRQRPCQFHSSLSIRRCGNGGRDPALPAGREDDMPLRFGALPPTAIHLCVDMQRLFAEPTEWQTPWMDRILPEVLRLVEADPARTLFTRFIPARNADAAPGTWRRYYQRWPAMTREALPPGLLDLLDPLPGFVPPARLFDKPAYSPWLHGNLHGLLQRLGADTCIVSGGETEICVLATLLGGIDRGYRVVLAEDALCSSADQTHDAMMSIYHSRFGMQLELAGVDEIIEAWRH